MESCPTGRFYASLGLIGHGHFWAERGLRAGYFFEEERAVS